MPDPFKQVEAILDNLRRRPDEDFNKFCNILCKHGQDEVVEKYLKPQKSEIEGWFHIFGFHPFTVLKTRPNCGAFFNFGPFCCYDVVPGREKK